MQPRGLYVLTALWMGCHVLSGLDELSTGDEDGTAQGGSPSSSQATQASVGGAGGTVAPVGGGSSVSTGGMGAGPCCDQDVDAGCPEDRDCESCVCGSDSFCCTDLWDMACASGAQGNCASACSCTPMTSSVSASSGPGTSSASGGGGDCCSAHPAPMCSSAYCNMCVCSSDSSCCNSSWHSGCVTLAQNMCSSPCGC